MKLKQFFMAVMAGAAVLVGCNKEEDLGPAKLEVSISEINFDREENAQDVTFTATRDWMVSGIPEWLALSAESGTASAKEQTVRVSATANSGYTRTAELVFTIGFARSAVTVTQQGPAGQKTEGSGTLDDPYTVAGVFEYIDGLGNAASPKKVFVEGIISSIKEEFSAQYGNAQFTISDDGTTAGNQFTAYRVYYLGNQRWKEGDTQIKLGDKVVIYGNVVNYNGTRETEQGNAFLYSLNGVDNGGADGGSTGEGEAKGSGTLEDPYNPAGICAVAGALADNASTEASYYIKGKITKVQTSFADSGTYGNANFYISDSEDGTGEFYIFQTYYLGARQWKSGDTDVKEGDVVVVYGPVTKYVGSSGNPTLETVGKGASHIVSLNGVTADGGDTPGGDEPGGEPAGGDWASNITWTSGSGGAYSETASINGTADVPLLKLGTSSAVGSSTLTLPAGSTFLRFYALSWNNKPATLVIKANGTEVATIKPAVNSGVANTAPYTITGVSDSDRYTVTFPATTTLTVETTDASNPRIILFAAIATTGTDPDEGKPENPGDDKPGETVEPKGTGTESDPFNVAAAIAEAEKAGEVGTEESYYIKGKVASVTEQFSATYGNGTFTLVDEGSDATFIAYRIYYMGNRKWVEGDQMVNAGDEIVVCGKIVNYKGNTPETLQGSAYLVSINGSGSTGDDKPGTDNPNTTHAGTAEDPFSVADALVVAAKSPDEEYYVKGIISKIDEISTQYGNATYFIYDAPGGAELEIFRSYAFNGEKFTKDDALKVGDEVVVCGKLIDYNGTLEMTTGGKLISVNGKTSFDDNDSGDDNPGDTPGDDKPGTDTPSQPGTYSFDFSAQGYANAAEVSNVSFDGVTVTFDKGTNSNSPKYYTTGTAVRVYGSNTITVEAGGKTITGVTFTFGKDDSGESANAITADSGSYASPSWTGSAKSVTFTIGGTSGHRRIAAIMVTVADDGNAGGNDTPGDNQSGKASYDFSAQGYANAAEISNVSFDGVTVTFDKGTNSNSPKYYTTGTAVRVYGSNTITVEADGKTITGVTFTFGKDDGGESANAITADSGSYASPSWTGSAKSVTFTIGGTSGHRRIAAIEVSYQ